MDSPIVEGLFTIPLVKSLKCKICYVICLIIRHMFECSDALTYLSANIDCAHLLFTDKKGFGILNFHRDCRKEIDCEVRICWHDYWWLLMAYDRAKNLEKDCWCNYWWSYSYPSLNSTQNPFPIPTQDPWNQTQPIHLNISSSCPHVLLLNNYYAWCPCQTHLVPCSRLFFHTILDIFL